MLSCTPEYLSCIHHNHEKPPRGVSGVAFGTAVGEGPHYDGVKLDQGCPPPPCLGTALRKERPLVPRSNCHATFFYRRMANLDVPHRVGRQQLSQSRSLGSPLDGRSSVCRSRRWARTWAPSCPQSPQPQGCIGRAGEVTPPLQGAQPMPSHCPPHSLAFETDSNRPQPLRQPPPTACLTASGAASEAPSPLMHPYPHLRPVLLAPLSPATPCQPAHDRAHTVGQRRTDVPTLVPRHTRCIQAGPSREAFK